MRRIEAYPVISTTGDKACVEASSTLQFHGWAARETGDPSGAAAFNIRHGGSKVSDKKLFPIELSANQSRAEGPWPEGIRTPNGIFCEVVSGEVDLVVFASVDKEIEDKAITGQG